MNNRTIPTCQEMIGYLTSTGVSYTDMTRAVGCHCSTIVRLRDRSDTTPRQYVIDGLYKLYVKRMSEIAPLAKKVEELGL